MPIGGYPFGGSARGGGLPARFVPHGATPWNAKQPDALGSQTGAKGKESPYEPRLRMGKFFTSLHHAVWSAAPPQELLEGVVSGVCHLRRDSFPDDETWERF